MIFRELFTTFLAQDKPSDKGVIDITILFPNQPQSHQGAHWSGKYDFSSSSGNPVKWSGKLESFQKSEFYNHAWFTPQ